MDIPRCQLLPEKFNDGGTLEKVLSEHPETRESLLRNRPKFSKNYSNL